MPNYKCLIRGEHFPGELIGSTGLCGFYTTRWLVALNEKQAEMRAVETLKSEPGFALPEGAPASANAHVFVEEVTRIARLPRLRGGGATWFAEDEDLTKA